MYTDTYCVSGRVGTLDDAPTALMIVHVPFANIHCTWWRHASSSTGTGTSTGISAGISTGTGTSTDISAGISTGTSACASASTCTSFQRVRPRRTRHNITHPNHLLHQRRVNLREECHVSGGAGAMKTAHSDVPKWTPVHVPRPRWRCRPSQERTWSAREQSRRTRWCAAAESDVDTLQCKRRRIHESGTTSHERVNTPPR